MADDKPYSRKDFAGALAVNAAAKPFNIALFVGTMAAAVAVSGPVGLAAVAATTIYGLGCARTFFDDNEADKVLARERGTRRAAIESGRRRVDPEQLAKPIRKHLIDARATEARIREAIDRAELPYAEVTEEVDQLVQLMEQSASRAQLLWEGLADNPPERTEQRLAQLQGSGKAELVDALTHQLTVQRKMESQLERFYDEMERVCVELDTIRASLLSVSASTDRANQERLAGDVRALREDLGTLASGMSEAFEHGGDAAKSAEGTA